MPRETSNSPTVVAEILFDAIDLDRSSASAMMGRPPPFEPVPLCAEPFRAEWPRCLGETACQNIAADCLGRQRGQQNSVAVMAGGDNQALDPARTEHRGVVSRTRTKPTQVSAIGSSSMAGTARQAPSISANKPPAVNSIVEAALLDRPADDQSGRHGAARDILAAATRHGSSEVFPVPSARPASGL